MLVPFLAFMTATSSPADPAAWEPWLGFALPGSVQILRGDWLAGGLLAGSSALLLGAQLADVAREPRWTFPLAQLALAGTSAWLAVRPPSAVPEKPQLGGSVLGWIEAGRALETSSMHGLADATGEDGAIR